MSVVAVLAVILLVGITSVLLSRTDPVTPGEPSPTPFLDAPPIVDDPDDDAEPAEPAPGQTQQGEPGPPSTATAAPARDPDAEATSFAQRYETETLGGEATWTVEDVEGDGVPEVVFASIASDATRIDVAEWNGRRYEIVFQDQGGPADVVDRLDVTDYTGDGLREIVTVQSAGEQGESLSVWGVTGGSAYARQPAHGGCWDGSNTYGVVGATIEAGRITATCDGAPLPIAAWPSDVYVWVPGAAEDQPGAWTYDHTEQP